MVGHPHSTAAVPPHLSRWLRLALELARLAHLKQRQPLPCHGVIPTPTDDGKEKSRTHFSFLSTTEKIRHGMGEAVPEDQASSKLPVCRRSRWLSIWELSLCKTTPPSHLHEFSSHRLKSVWQKLQRIQKETKSPTKHITLL